MARVALHEALRAGVVGEHRAVLALVHGEADVGDDLRVALVGDVDDPRGADLGPVGGGAVVVLRARELVDLGQVGPAADRDRLGDLRDRPLRPVELGDLLELRALLAGLDLARVEDEQALAGGDVGAVAVVGDRQAVRVVVRDRDDHRDLRVREVDGGDVAGRDRGRVERVAVGREAGLMAEDPDRQRALQHRVAAVLVEVVDVDDAGIDDRVARHRGEQPAPLVEQHGLVRGLHRGREQARRLHRLRRIAHVEHGDAGRALGQRLRVGREQQRRVVVRALPPGLVLESQRLVAAGVAVVADEARVAGEPLGVAGGHAALDVGLRPAAGTAVRPRHRRGLRRLRGVRRDLLGGAAEAQRQAVRVRVRGRGGGGREQGGEHEQGQAHAGNVAEVARRARRFAVRGPPANVCDARICRNLRTLDR